MSKRESVSCQWVIDRTDSLFWYSTMKKIIQKYYDFVNQ